ncbi:RxLR effector protein [Phytophthora megakarya]|uniref:RxLR effector protein n=1 Tax=Phytophthora megakarya TaxID=4795 RepID=A0A225VJT3_9STRA|nr:RxLR effector protein [Phytophthora megakarya]
MRVTNVILATTVLSANWMAANAEKPVISSKISTGFVSSIAAGPNSDNNNEQRFLRSNRAAGDKEGINDDEERFKQGKIDDLIAGRTSTLFAKWKGKKYSEDYIYTKLKKRLPPSVVNDVMRWYRNSSYKRESFYVIVA